MEAWQLMASLHAYLIGGASLKQIEDNKYEVLTPYQDTKGRIVLYASQTNDNRIRLSDGGYLTENFLKLQDPTSPFHVEMGVQHGNEDGDCRMENGELVIYANDENFGQSVCTLAHGLLLLGTSKQTMIMMIQVFKAVLTGQVGPGIMVQSEPAAEIGDDLSWAGIDKTKFEA